MSAALAKVAAEHAVESVTAVALAYVMAKSRVERVACFPIVGGHKVEHLADNIAALTIELSTEQVAYLEAESDAAAPFDVASPPSSRPRSQHHRLKLAAQWLG